MSGDERERFTEQLMRSQRLLLITTDPRAREALKFMVSDLEGKIALLDQERPRHFRLG
jgi:hypothetical protein